MLNVKLKYQGFDTLSARIRQMEIRLLDLRPLAEKIGRIMWEDNAESRSFGLDQYGVNFKELAPATWKKRKGVGPPLAPYGVASPIITDYTIDIFEHHPGWVSIRGTWPNTHWVHFHADDGSPRTHLPVRDPLGVSPQGQDRIIATFDEFTNSLMYE